MKYKVKVQALLGVCVVAFWLAWMPLLATAQSAPTSDNPIPQVFVDSSVTDIGNGQWLYEYTFNNSTYCSTSICLSNSAVWNINIPTFSDVNVSQISAPAGWNGSITYTGIVDSCFCQLPQLTWSDQVSSFSQNILAGTSLGGFSYIANYAGTKYPFDAYSWGGQVFAGDPLGPASPLALQALTVTSVPEPSTFIIMFAGICAFRISGLSLQRRRTSYKELNCTFNVGLPPQSVRWPGPAGYWISPWPTTEISMQAVAERDMV